MTTKKPSTHRAYCILRQGRRGAGYWVEIPPASVVADGNDLRIFLPLQPISGFDGHILLRRIDAEPEPFPPDPEEEDEEDV